MNQLDHLPEVSQPSDTFVLQFEEPYFRHKEVIIRADNCKYVVVCDPYKKFFSRILEFVSFGYYKAKWQYEVVTMPKQESAIIDSMIASQVRGYSFEC